MPCTAVLAVATVVEAAATVVEAVATVAVTVVVAAVTVAVGSVDVTVSTAWVVTWAAVASGVAAEVTADPLDRTCVMPCTVVLAPVTAGRGAWLTSQARQDDGAWFAPGATTKPGGGAAANVDAGRPPPVRLGAVCPRMLGRLGSMGGPVRTGCCGWTRWRDWLVPAWIAGGDPDPNRPGGSAGMTAAITKVKITMAVTTPALGTATPAGCTRAAAATDLEVAFVRSIARPPRLRISCMVDRTFC
jgi:hypothetical protein